MVEIDEKQIYAIVQKAKESGKVRVGVNEVTKSIERGEAKLVLGATDVSPAEIIAHLNPLCKEMKVLYFNIGTKVELGSLVGVKSASSLAIIDLGNAKDDFEKLKEKIEFKEKEDNKEEDKKEDKENTKKEEEAKEE